MIITHKAGGCDGLFSAGNSWGETRHVMYQMRESLLKGKYCGMSNKNSISKDKLLCGVRAICISTYHEMNIYRSPYRHLWDNYTNSSLFLFLCSCGSACDSRASSLSLHTGQRERSSMMFWFNIARKGEGRLGPDLGQQLHAYSWFC